MFSPTQGYADWCAFHGKFPFGTLKIRIHTQTREVCFSAGYSRLQVRYAAQNAHELTSCVARDVGASFGVEDESGWAHIVRLFNFPGVLTASGLGLDTMFPLDTIVAIREPIIEVAAPPINFDISVYSPSDIVFLRPNDPLLLATSWQSGKYRHPVFSRSSAEWKSIGDQLFRSQDYFPAVVAYSNALHLDPDSVAVRLNRSLARMRLGHHGAAGLDLDAVVQTKDLGQQDRIKAIYRSAQMIYTMTLRGDIYKGVKALFQKCVELDDKRSEARAGAK